MKHNDEPWNRGISPYDEEPEELPTYEELQSQVKYWKGRFEDETRAYQKQALTQQAEIGRMYLRIKQLEAKIAEMEEK